MTAPGGGANWVVPTSPGGASPRPRGGVRSPARPFFDFPAGHNYVARLSFKGGIPLLRESLQGPTASAS